MKKGIELIAIERQEQIEKHGYHDENYNDNEELVDAALHALGRGKSPANWEDHFPEKIAGKNWIECLVVAGALIAAQIDKELMKKS